eukprot:TRINITY_DN5089_c0_g1_i1.p1 TRINITY_DN5089_c0_g1~~TRINITY_DN5089_c0_g1_i1.p1  ORF type:complete len:513 (-),score=165.77 TRINITY_DN5089_c0_g1_i1:704-2203(-)
MQQQQQQRQHEYRYCECCKQSTDFKWHNTTKEHQQRLLTALQKEDSKMKACIVYIDQKLTSLRDDLSRNYWCRFCDSEATIRLTDELIGDDNNNNRQHHKKQKKKSNGSTLAALLSEYERHSIQSLREAIEGNKYLAYGFHVSSKAHQDKVEAFWRSTSVPLLLRSKHIKEQMSKTLGKAAAVTKGEKSNAGVSSSSTPDSLLAELTTKSNFILSRKKRNKMKKELLVLAGFDEDVVHEDGDENNSNDDEKKKKKILRDTPFYSFEPESVNSQQQPHSHQTTMTMPITTPLQHPGYGPYHLLPHQSYPLIPPPSLTTSYHPLGTNNNNSHNYNYHHQLAPVTTPTASTSNGDASPQSDGVVVSKLTYIGQTHRNLPNIHTGAVPPWLRASDDGDNNGDDDDDKVMLPYGCVGGLIGPSIPNNININNKKTKHREKNPKKLRNTQAAPTSLNQQKKLKRSRDDGGDGGEEETEWLPSFGGVWQSATRSRFQSKLDFFQKK